MLADDLELAWFRIEAAVGIDLWIDCSMIAMTK